MIALFVYFIIAVVVMIGVIINELKHNTDMNNDIRDRCWWIALIVISLLWPFELAILVSTNVKTCIINSKKTES